MMAILARYTKIAPQAFAQMGFMVGKFATQALMNVKGPSPRSPTTRPCAG